MTIQHLLYLNTMITLVLGLMWTHESAKNLTIKVVLLFAALMNLIAIFK